MFNRVLCRWCKRFDQSGFYLGERYKMYIVVRTSWAISTMLQHCSAFPWALGKGLLHTPYPCPPLNKNLIEFIGDKMFIMADTQMHMCSVHPHQDSEVGFHSGWWSGWECAQQLAVCLWFSWSLLFGFFQHKSMHILSLQFTHSVLTLALCLLDFCFFIPSWDAHSPDS